MDAIFRCWGEFVILPGGGGENCSVFLRGQLPILRFSFFQGQKYCCVAADGGWGDRCVWDIKNTSGEEKGGCKLLYFLQSDPVICELGSIYGVNKICRTNKVKKPKIEHKQEEIKNCIFLHSFLNISFVRFFYEV